MSPVSMKQVWILAWLLLPVSWASVKTRGSDEDGSNDHESETERSLKKRQLNFEGGGGGVNRYVNGDQADYEDQYGDNEYWAQVGNTLRSSAGRRNLFSYIRRWITKFLNKIICPDKQK